MTENDGKFGLSCALATPFAEDGSPDLARLVAQARWCLDQGCRSVTAFGTTGEGPSIGLSARRAVVSALREAGIGGPQLVMGVVASAVEDALDQARQAYEAECRAILLAPPFYFKDPSEEGLFRWFSGFFDALGPLARDVILYHIPSVTAVPLPVSLITRLRAAYPGVILGVKDSSGDWNYAQALLAEHRDLVILIGDERQLAQAVGIGAQGAISGMANIYPDRLLRMIEQARPDPALSRAVDELLRYPVTPGVKALVAERTGDPEWARTRAPLLPLSAEQAAALTGAFRELLSRKEE
ncbi:dihydrodipicolinate synthase family protein [Roseomonas elaeocarpi]|uniref:Dihydrodipicolinate synthase family protein n=1 Tax=Roseomonas elaeocarpi TaxID=907779 RepID=A0ABV6JS95_9PROT